MLAHGRVSGQGEAEITDERMSGVKILHHPNFDFPVPEGLHPFPMDRACAAARILSSHLGADTWKALSAAPSHEISRKDLERTHSAGHLDSISAPEAAAKIFEADEVRLLLDSEIDTILLRPQRWICAGTLMAAKAALTSGSALSTAGGLHHAAPSKGGGFCAYADLPVALAALRAEGALADGGRIAICDLDAHMGNGTARCLLDDPSAVLMDVHCPTSYPRDAVAFGRIDIPVLLDVQAEDDAYLSALERGLSELAGRGPFALIVLLLGTDPFEDDPVGPFRLTEGGILERDRIAIQACRRNSTPFLVLPAGGYSDQSARLLAETIEKAAVAS